MGLPKVVVDLIGRFEQHLDSYKSGQYNETQLRREFLDPFFKALGWDVDNESGYAEAYKDVIHEDAIRIGGAVKAPDYCFRIGGSRKFFLEAKKPSVCIKDEPSPAYQLRRYAWSAKLSLSILSDFEEFAVYDCRIRPDKADKASAARIFYCTFSEYAEKWDWIAEHFSREAVLKGSFDKFAESARAKKGTAEVDAAFLAEIENWRRILAGNLALRNPRLSQRELNFAVQRIIDRIIFLRICEDRGIEDYGQLLALTNGNRTYQRLCQMFNSADDRYNSGLFHFKKEKDRHEAPDELTLDLDVDDKLLREILRSLYYPDSPYEFSVLPADILGQVYEQFLGKVIRLTAGHRAAIDDKPEVKKAGGVYYTPTYIVDYIVKNTVGALVDGKAPAQVAKLRVLDPACGSGSFLIGAYQYLLDWHRDWYMQNDPAKWAAGKKPALVQTHDGEWRLTIAERKRILLNNIYGVDIDSQAVEVTKLSLLLKVLEGETEQSLQPLRLFHERALPDLGHNIKCGNSLIGPDFYSQQMLPLDEEERMRINVFDWQAEFSEVFKSGGFDAVIGNPPYIRIQTMKEWAPLEVEFYKSEYTSASSGNYDVYVVFVEKGLDLLNKKGRLGFILPHKFFNAQYGEGLRSLISKGKHLESVVHFQDQQIFAGATTYTCLLSLNKTGSDSCHYMQVTDLSEWRNAKKSKDASISASTFTSTEWNISTNQAAPLYAKLNNMPIKLRDIAHLFVGLQTDADDVFILEEVGHDGELVLCESKATGRRHWLENIHLKPFLKGSLNIRRYLLANVTKRLIFPYEISNEKSLLIDVKEYCKRFPLTWAYLEENKERLSKRKKGSMGKEWYGYVYKKNHMRFDSPKLLVPSIATGSCFSEDLDGKYYFVGSGGGGGGGYGITLSDVSNISYLYLLGILNSRLLSEYLKSISTPFRGGYYALNRQYIEALPIHTVDFNKKSDKARHDKMVKLVEQMLSLNKQLAAARTPQEKTALERQISATDKQIDQLVYELYDLTPEEVSIIEGI